MFNNLKKNAILVEAGFPYTKNPQMSILVSLPGKARPPSLKVEIKDFDLDKIAISNIKLESCWRVPLICILFLSSV